MLKIIKVNESLNKQINVKINTGLLKSLPFQLFVYNFRLRAEVEGR